MTTPEHLPRAGRMVFQPHPSAQDTVTEREPEADHRDDSPSSFEQEYYAALDALKREGQHRFHLEQTNEVLLDKLNEAKEEKVKDSLEKLNTLEKDAEMAYQQARKSNDIEKELAAQKLLRDISARKEVFEYDRFKNTQHISQSADGDEYTEEEPDIYNAEQANRAYAAFEQRNPWMKNSKMRAIAQEEAEKVNQALEAQGQAHLIHTPDYYAYIEQKVTERRTDQAENKRSMPAETEEPSLAEEYNQDLKKRGYQTGTTFSREQLENVAERNISVKTGRNSWTNDPVDVLSIYAANKHRIEKIDNGIRIHGRNKK